MAEVLVIKENGKARKNVSVTVPSGLELFNEDVI